MSPFKGFPEGKTRLTPVPAGFFTDLLPDIDNLGELKLTLYALWRLDRMEGAIRWLERGDFLDDERFLGGMAPTYEAACAAVDDALERAVQRGSLLRSRPSSQPDGQALYFLNTPRGRSAAQAYERGAWSPGGQPRGQAALAHEPANIFRLYEEHIGPLTPMIAETLRDAENTYPPAWIEEAVRIAVENNKRNWRYVAAILTRWQQEGRDERKDQPDSEKSRRRYIEGEFSDFIEH